MNNWDIQQKIVYTIDGKDFNTMEDAAQYVEITNTIKEYYKSLPYNADDAAAIRKFLKWYINK